MSIICPVCRERLSFSQGTYRCENSHSFDVASEGYVNLLLSHQRRSKNPGDDKTMIQARRRFFDAGAYDALIELICTTVPEPACILDCGCGEGHVLGALKGTRLGLDVSKDAIRAAAKRYAEPFWMVANGMRNIPIADQSMDVILSVLAPRNMEEFQRILKPNGQLILGVPGLNHLIELRSLLEAGSGDFSEKADEAASKCSASFTEISRQPISYTYLLNQDQLADLVQMTPIFWNSSPQAKECIHSHSELSVTISFVLQVFEIG